MKFTKIILSLFAILSAPIAFAGSPFLIKVKEGFSATLPAETFKDAWDSTLAIVQMNGQTAAGRTASGVVVFKENRGGFTYLGVLTAGHVISDMYQKEKRIYPIPMKVFEYDSKSGKINNDFFDQTGLLANSFFTSKKDLDVGLIVIKTTQQDGDKVKAIPFSGSCDLNSGDPLIAFGYPNVDLRRPELQRVPIPDSQKIEKRASVGVFISNDGKYGATTTVDSLPGNSGGPVLNERGEIVGVLTKALAMYSVGGVKNQNAEIDYPYLGNETPTNLQHHSIMSSCRGTKNYAMDSWEQAIKTFPKDI